MELKVINQGANMVALSRALFLFVHGSYLSVCAHGLSSVALEFPLIRALITNPILRVPPS
jgi:hypothetical protein